MKNNSILLFLLFAGIFAANAQNNETLAEIPAGYRKGKKVKVKVRPSSPTLSPAPQPPGYISKVKGKKYYNGPTGDFVKKSTMAVSQASMETDVLPRSGSDSATANVAVQKPKLNTDLPTQNSVLPPENAGISETSMASEGLQNNPPPSIENGVIPRVGSQNDNATIITENTPTLASVPPPTPNSMIITENTDTNDMKLALDDPKLNGTFPMNEIILPRSGSENDNVTAEHPQPLVSLRTPIQDYVLTSNLNETTVALEQPLPTKDIIIPQSGYKNENATREYPQPLVSLKLPIQDSVLSMDLNETTLASEVPQSTIALPRSEPENVTATVALDNLQSMPIISSSPVTVTSKAKGSLNSAGYASSNSPSTVMKKAKPLKGDKTALRNAYSYSYSYAPTIAPIAKNGIIGGDSIPTSKPTRVSKKVLPTSVGNITFTYYHQDNTELSKESIKAPAPTTSDLAVPTASPLKFVQDSATSKAPTSLKGLKKSEFSSDKPFSQAPTKVSKKILPTPVDNITFSYFDNNATTTEESARSFLNETWNADPVKLDSSTTEVVPNATQPLTGLPAKSKPLQKGSRDWK